MQGKPAMLACGLSVLLGCDLISGETTPAAESAGEKTASEASEAKAAPAGAAPTKENTDAEGNPGSESAGDVELSAVERRPGSSPVDQAGRPVKGPIRGPIAWKPPAHWTPRRDAGKPFILGEYGLAGHTEERPALCRLIHNSSYSSTKTDVEQATSEAKRTRLRDDSGKSLLSTLTPTVERIGALEWYVVFAEGRYREPGSFGKSAPEDMLPGYAQMNLIPAIEGTRVSLRCWAPAETMKGEVKAMRAWAASVEYPTKG